jgi:tetratricopeptide (TPR) repeat protein
MNLPPGPTLPQGCLALVVCAILHGAVPDPGLADLRHRIEADDRKAPVASLRCEEEALRRLDQGGDPRETVWFALAWMRDARALGDAAQALKIAERYRPLVQARGQPMERFQLEMEAGLACHRLEHFAESASLLEALRPTLGTYLAEHPGDREAQRLEGRLLHLLGVDLGTLGRPGEALKALGEALRLDDAIGDRLGVAVVLDARAAFHRDLGQLAEAAQDDLQAIRIAHEAGNLDMESSLRMKHHQHLPAQGGLGASDHGAEGCRGHGRPGGQ